MAQANPAPSTGAGGLPAGVDEESVSTIVAITNKPRDQCIQALQLARGNADLACSLLMEGVDLNQVAGAMGPGGGPGQGQDDYADYGDEDMAGQPGAGAGMPPGMGMGGMPGMGGAGMNQDQAALMGLMANPQFAQIAQRMRENPQIYQDFMSRLQTDNP